MKKIPKEIVDKSVVRRIAEQMKIASGQSNVAMKPITYEDTNRADCPICKATVRGIGKPFGDYCSHCGQKLDWSESR